MQAVGPAPARHHASGELVDDDDFAILHYIFDVTAIQVVRLDRGLDVMFPAPVLGVGDISNAEQTLNFLPSFIGDGDGLVLLIDHVVAGQDLFVDALLNLLAFNQARNNAVHAIILVGGFLT